MAGVIGLVWLEGGECVLRYCPLEDDVVISPGDCYGCEFHSCGECIWDWDAEDNA